MEVAGFDWDPANTAKCRSHGVATSEIEALFRATPQVAPDPKHSTTEDRFIAIGRNKQGRPLFVAFRSGEKAGNG